MGVSASERIRRKASFDCNHSRLETSQSRINLKRSVGKEMYVLTNFTEEKLGKQVCERMLLSLLLSYQTSKEPTVKIIEITLTLKVKILKTHTHTNARDPRTHSHIQTLMVRPHGARNGRGVGIQQKIKHK